VNTRISTIIWLVAAVVLSSAQVGAHSWYPKECCSGNDCAPVEKATWLVPVGGGLPQLVVTSGVGTAIVPNNFPVRDSKDGRTSASKTCGSFASLCHRACRSTLAWQDLQERKWSM
jgi:hypothetical protein